ncbi:MAG: YfcE family phosphodiesterase [Candidatus Anstonellales archaeon]
MRFQPGDRIGILGDIHYPDRIDRIPEHMLRSFREFNTNKIIFTGDLTSYDDVIDEFNPEEYIVVKGNIDEFIAPRIVIVDIGINRILITHGDIIKPRGDREKIFNMMKSLDANIFISGHTHIPILINESNRLIFNPGSFSMTYSFGILEINMNFIKFELFKDNKIIASETVPY